MDRARELNQQHLRPYSVTREFKFYDNQDSAQKGEDVKSHVIAVVNFEPPNHKVFEIQESDGSRRGEYVVRHMLENESEMATRNAPPPLTSENYDLKLVGDEVLDGHPCWVLAVSPRRDEKGTFIGNAWIDKASFLTRQIKGQMAKNPSWWVKSVQIEMTYGNAAGMWLPTATYAIADVRVFGKHVLASRSVKLESGGQVVESFQSATPRFSSFSAERNESVHEIPPILGSQVYFRK